MNFYSEIEKYKDNKAIILDDELFFSYNQLIDLANKLSKNIEKKKLILVLMDNEIETIISMIASDLNQNVIMSVNSIINYNALDKIIITYKPDFIFFNKNKNLNLKGYSYKCDFINYRLISRKKNHHKELHQDLFMLVSTSGSTGSKKQVMLSKQNLSSNTYSIIKDLKIFSKDVCITTLPPGYVYGMSIINTHLLSGAKIILNKSSVIEKDFWRKIKHHKVNTFGGVPYTYELIHRFFLKKENFTNVKYITQAGGFLSDNIKFDIIKFLKKNNKKFITMYGAAEGTARLSYLPWRYAEKKNGSIGIPIYNGNFFIMDQINKEIKEPNKEGCLFYKGENVFLGYSVSFKDLKNQSNKKNILNTGDIAFKDKDGFYYLKGKLTRFVKLFGNRISLDELENIIFKFGIKTVCVQNKKDSISIFVIHKINENLLLNFISNYTSINKKAFKILIIKKFPLLENDKIDYKNKIFKYE